MAGWRRPSVLYRAFEIADCMSIRGSIELGGYFVVGQLTPRGGTLRLAVLRGQTGADGGPPRLVFQTEAVLPLLVPPPAPSPDYAGEDGAENPSRLAEATYSAWTDSGDSAPWPEPAAEPSEGAYAAEPSEGGWTECLEATSPVVSAPAAAPAPSAPSGGSSSSKGPPAAEPSPPEPSVLSGLEGPTTWEGREAGAFAAGETAAARIHRRNLPLGPFLPRSSLPARCYILLRDRNGTIHQPAKLFHRWCDLAGWVRVHHGFQLHTNSVFCGFPSLREARAYCLGAGVDFPPEAEVGDL